VTPQGYVYSECALAEIEAGHFFYLLRRKGRAMHKATLETTLGDLIVALTEETDRQVRDEKMTYQLVAYILADLMKNSRRVSRPV